MAKISRRKLIIGGTATAGVGVASIAGLAILGPRISTWVAQSGVTTVDHVNPLKIPPLETGRIENGVRHFSLNLQEGSSEIVAGKTTTTWGANGNYLGPTLRASRGEQIQVAVQNDLPEETSIHWHGMHLPAEMDGGPHQMIAPGEDWTPTWEIDQPASTLWYHPHPHGKTAKHVWNGLAGLFIVDDDEAATLPQEYGVDDVPLILQDRKLQDDGDFNTTDWAFGYFGDRILVNGTDGAMYEVTHRLTRFRILNGSNTRWYNLTFADERPFQLIATDSGYVGDIPPELTNLLLSPGERAEIIVEFAAGDDVMLMSKGEDRWNLADYGAENDFDVIRFLAAGQLEDSPEILVPSFNSELGEPATENRRRYKLNGHSSINDKEMDMTRIDDVITARSVEYWEIDASNFASHNFHIHGVSFEILDVDGEEPPIHQRGPKDTAQVLKSKKVTIRVQFPGHTDEQFPFMYHCHILRHEDQGMMGQFLVVEPGREGEAPRELDSSHAHH